MAIAGHSYQTKKLERGIVDDFCDVKMLHPYDKNKIVKLIRVPKFAEVPYPVIMEPSLVIEYFSV